MTDTATDSNHGGALPHDEFEGWSVLELFGHRRLGGYVREVEFAGARFVRIDIPEVEGQSAATQLYGAAAVYCLTATTEEIARAVADSFHPEPVSVWQLPALKAPTPRRTWTADDDYVDPDE